MTEEEFEEQVESEVNKIASELQDELDTYYCFERISVQVTKLPKLMALIESSVRRDLTT